MFLWICYLWKTNRGSNICERKIKAKNQNGKCFHITVAVVRASSRHFAFWVATADLPAGSWPSPGRQRAALTTARLRLDLAPLGCSTEPGNEQTHGHSLVPGFWEEDPRQERQYLVYLVRRGEQWQPLQPQVKLSRRHVLQLEPLTKTEAETAVHFNKEVFKRHKRVNCERDLMLMALHSILL